MVIKIAYYRKKDWNKFIKMIDDRHSMHENWEDWEQAFQKTKSDLQAKGFKVALVEVNLTDLRNFCNSRGIKNDGSARSQFVKDQ